MATDMGTPITDRTGARGRRGRASAETKADGDGRDLPHPRSNVAADGVPWVAGLLQISDSFYPTGAYAHSFGLEGMTQAGVVTDRATLQSFMLGEVLPQLARTDLPIAARAWAAAGEPPDWPRLREACFLGGAVRGSREPREASEGIGRQRLELLARLHGGLSVELNRRAEAEGWPRPAGRLTIADLPASIGAETTVFVCGSSGFADAATDMLLSAGVGNERIRVERFGPTG